MKQKAFFIIVFTLRALFVLKIFTFRFTFQSPGLPSSKSNYFHYDRNPYEFGRRKRLIYIKKSALMLTLDSYCCIWVTLTGKREWVKYKYERCTFAFTSWEIRRPGKFCASFLYAHINMAFCFYIYGPLQVVCAYKNDKKAKMLNIHFALSNEKWRWWWNVSIYKVRH